MKKITIIGAGFSGLSSAIKLAHDGYDVSVFEKNSIPGGRASKWEKDGFSFDLGPSWYWMPDVFENFFHKFDRKIDDYYKLTRLDPSYRVYFGKNDFIDLPANINEMYTLFDSLEAGSSKKLKLFLNQAKYKYVDAMNDYVLHPSYNISEFIDLNMISQLFRMQLLSSLRNHVAKNFSNERIKKYWNSLCYFWVPLLQILRRCTA